MEVPRHYQSSQFIPDLLAISLNFPILDTLKSASLETKPRTADTPLCPDSDYGRLAQLVRAPRLHRGGRGFEPLSAHQLFPQGSETIPRTPKNLEFFGVLCFQRFGPFLAEAGFRVERYLSETVIWADLPNAAAYRRGVAMVGLLEPFSRRDRLAREIPVDSLRSLNEIPADSRAAFRVAITSSSAACFCAA